MKFEEFKEKILMFRDYDPEDWQLIKKAFDFGQRVFKGIKRKSGEPYFNHCLRTALNLAELKLSASTICAGILHDVLEDTEVSQKELEENFGKEIAFLVNGVTNFKTIRYQEKDLQQAENLRKLILNMAEDLRVAILKLADRLDNMRTLEFLPPEKRRRFALETQDIYAPLALRFGLSEWAGELDDLAFKFLEPEKYKEIRDLIKEKISDGEKILKEVEEKVKEELGKRKIKLRIIQSRIKRPSSVYKKLKRKNFDIDQIFDLLAVRVIVTTVEECYLTLGVIHSLYKPILEEFNDYIAYPKPNGYQSLHTTCFLKEGIYIEFQIRTEEMHIKNEEGLAAYFAYADAKQTKIYQKENPVFAKEDELKIFQEIKKWKDSPSTEKFLKSDFLKEKIYVFTPKGNVIELPLGSIPLDFAYKIHTDIGNTYAGAKVNGKMVPIDYELKTGDIVEIINQKNKKPSPDWLQIVKTYEAKKKIRSYLKKMHPSFFQKNYSFEIIAKDRIGLLRDIANVISSEGINIIGTKSKVKDGFTRIYVEVKLNDKKELERLKENLKKKIKEITKIN